MPATDQTRREVESYRYRLLAMLVEIRRQAKARGNVACEKEIARLAADIRAVEVAEAEGGDQAAYRALQAIAPRVTRLGESVGVRFGDDGLLPKWARLMLVGLPALLIAVLLAYLFERRRRKARIEAAELEALDSAGEGNQEARVGRERAPTRQQTKLDD